LLFWFFSVVVILFSILFSSSAIVESISPCPPSIISAVPSSAHPECHAFWNISLYRTQRYIIVPGISAVAVVSAMRNAGL